MPHYRCCSNDAAKLKIRGELIKKNHLGRVDNSLFERLRPAACPRDPEILLHAQAYCTELDRTGSREQVAGRRDLNCQQTLASLLSHYIAIFFHIT